MSDSKAQSSQVVRCSAIGRRRDVIELRRVRRCNEETIGTNQCAQCEVTLQGGPWRSDAEHLALAQDGAESFQSLTFRCGLAVQQRMANPQITLYELVAEPAAVAEEVAVHLVVIAIHDAAQCAIPFANSSVATQPAMNADGWCHLEVPLARVVALERRIRKYTRWADFNQVAAEFVFQNTVFMSPKVDGVA